MTTQTAIIVGDLRRTSLEATVLHGKYLVGEPIASSRFSDLYAGVQLSTSLPVVIKTLHMQELPATQRNELDKRFQREASIYSDLNHPNLVRLIDQGMLVHMHFLVLELIEGETLLSVLARERRLDPFEAKHLMLQCLDALGCGHRAGIVHRDFKPSNVMISDTGLRRNAIVLDFGIAGSLQTAANPDKRITQPGYVPGTVSYLAPEQLLGTITPASDIYAWGLVFLECLAGEKVRQRPDTQGIYALLQSPINLPPELRGHPLGVLLERATASNMKDRYVRVEELFDDLVRCSIADVHIASRPFRKRENTEPAVPSAIFQQDNPNDDPTALLTHDELEVLHVNSMNLGEMTCLSRLLDEDEEA